MPPAPRVSPFFAPCLLEVYFSLSFFDALRFAISCHAYAFHFLSFRQLLMMRASGGSAQRVMHAGATRNM